MPPDSRNPAVIHGATPRGGGLYADDSTAQDESGRVVNAAAPSAAVGKPVAPPTRRGMAWVWALTVLVAVVVIVGFLLSGERNMAALLRQPWATWWTLAALFGATESFVVHVPLAAARRRTRCARSRPCSGFCS